jgi:hypothetical protein
MEFGAEYGGGLSELCDAMCDPGYVDGVNPEEFGREIGGKSEGANRESVTAIHRRSPSLTTRSPKTKRGNIRVIHDVLTSKHSIHTTGFSLFVSGPAICHFELCA